MIGLGTTWLMQLTNWWFWTTAPRRTFARRGSRPIWPSHAWLTGLRASARRFRLDGSAGHRIVDLLQGGKVVSVLCAVCGSHSGHVVRRSLLGKCPGTPPPGRLLALRDVLLGFLPGSKRTAGFDSIPGEVLRALSGTCRTRPISCVSAKFPFCVLIEPAPDMFKLGLTASNAAYQREFYMARDGARAASSVGSAASDGASSDEDLPVHSNMWCSLLEAAYHHSIGAFLAMNMCHSSMAALSQSCHFAVFVNPVARSSTHEFFTLCDVHSEHERTTQAACLQRRHE